MKKTILILILIFLAGCTTERIIYQNNTIIREVEVIKTINNTVECEKCLEPVPCPAINITRDCCGNLTMCHIRLDVMNDYLYDCLMLNDTLHKENITYEYNRCIALNDHYKGIIDNISGMADDI